MSASSRLHYWNRLIGAYVLPGRSQLTFWHGIPELNPDSTAESLGAYYMLFAAKSDYPGPYDEAGIPQLDYHGKVGLQYNPIAITQYGLGNYNLYVRNGDEERKDKFLLTANWLVDNLESTPMGTQVWNHHFDWEYRDLLRAPWYSALAQGQGISLLVRAHAETSDQRFATAAKDAFQTFNLSVSDGGVTFTDESGGTWFEETLVDPPTHILNGFMWAAWGIHDYYLHTGDDQARQLWEEAVETMLANLDRFDTGYWSLYELSGKRMNMLTSGFYHSLHIIQLRVMYQLSGKAPFLERAEKWAGYSGKTINRRRALAHKAIFKILYY
jgi:hypothetical protein